MGLRRSDLKNLVHKVFEVDTYQSKMGDDQDIVTLSFSVKSEQPAKDLVNFLESGYSFILDADATPGEQSDGTYKVFVEIERGRHAPEQILEIVEGITQLAEMDDWRFRYYKSFRSHPVSIEKLEETVPTDPDKYGISRNETNSDNFKTFFDQSYVESVEMLDDTITIRKKYADPLSFQFVDFGDKKEISDRINESFNINAFPEILFLTKYLGDYNISKYGNNLVFENGVNAVVLKRI